MQDFTEAVDLPRTPRAEVWHWRGPDPSRLLLQPSRSSTEVRTLSEFLSFLIWRFLPKMFFCFRKSWSFFKPFFWLLFTSPLFFCFFSLFLTVFSLLFPLLLSFNPIRSPWRETFWYSWKKLQGISLPSAQAVEEASRASGPARGPRPPPLATPVATTTTITTSKTWGTPRRTRKGVCCLLWRRMKNGTASATSWPLSGVAWHGRVSLLQNWSKSFNRGLVRFGSSPFLNSCCWQLSQLPSVAIGVYFSFAFPVVL